LPTLRAALGRAYGELEDFDEAIRHYTEVRTAHPADAPIWALEQLVSLEVRRAGAAASKGAQPRRRALERLAGAEEVLEHLLKLGETSERYALLGSLEKRRALLVGRRPDRRRALDRMVKAYTAAGGTAADRSGLWRAYALTGRLAGEIVLNWRARRRSTTRAIPASTDRGLHELDRMAEDLAQRTTSFFAFSLRGDHLLLRALARGRLDDTARREVEEAYRQARHRGVSPRHLASLRDQIAFLGTMAERDLDGRAATEVSTQLARLRAALE
jgi:tetratricopeptide (TPR) repeat protein